MDQKLRDLRTLKQHYYPEVKLLYLDTTLLSGGRTLISFSYPEKRHLYQNKSWIFQGGWGWMIITVAILVNIIAIGTQVEKDCHQLRKESYKWRCSINQHPKFFCEKKTHISSRVTKSENFPDKVRKSRQFSNSRQMRIKGGFARFCAKAWSKYAPQAVLTIEVPNLGLEIVDSQIWDFFNGKSPNLGVQNFKIWETICN